MVVIVWPDFSSRVATTDAAAALLKLRPDLRIHDITEWTGKYLETNPAPPPTHPRPGLKEPTRVYRLR